MSIALDLAGKARDCDEVPVGAVLVRDNKILGQGFNQPITLNDPTAHAEVLAIRDAAQNAGNYRLPDSTLYVTIEPCTMCVGALIHARVARVVYGAPEPRAGALHSNLQLHLHESYNHHFQVHGKVCHEECGALIATFFRNRRK